jgi:hypothetical protein
MNNIDEQVKKAMQVELEKYYKDNTSLKSYFQSMKELTTWLQGLSK